MRRRIAVLGSTGSIGVNTLKVAASLKKEIEVVALSAGSNIKLLAEQASVFKPKAVCVRDKWLAAKIEKRVPARTKVLYGPGGLEEIVSANRVDIVVFAISGSSCLSSLVSAIKNKKRIALANKEALVSAGAVIMKLAEEKGVSIIPIDSEHSAIFQCLEGKKDYLKKIILTASGGPLLNIPRVRFDRLPPGFIINHPKWKMGKKISVDSATMMNKGLEIIEARWLFDIEEKNIEVLIHPEAIIHSMVELIDGTLFAELSKPDMRLPIQYALTYPHRFNSRAPVLNFSKIREITFQEPDLDKFPCLSLAREALKKKSTYPAVLNIADEVVVGKYLEGRIKFNRIPFIIEKVMDRHAGKAKKELSIDDILNAESWAREEALKLCQ